MSPAETDTEVARFEALVARTLAEATDAHTDADAAHEEAVALVERLRRARETLVEATEAAEQSLGRLAAQGEQDELRLEALAAPHHAAVVALGEALDAHEDTLDDAADAVADAVAAELRAAAEATAALDERLARTLAEVEGLRREADALIARVLDAGGRVSDGIGAIQAQVDALLDLLERTVGEAASLLEQRLAAVDDLLGRARLDALDAGRRAFLDDALRRLELGATGLGDALDALGAGAREGRGQVEGGAGRLLDQMSGVVQAIERLRPVLDLVQELLT